MGSFSLTHWFIFGLIVWGIIAMLRSGKGGDQLHCMTCGTDAPGATRTRGSILIEIILWICFIVPGLIYSIWRLSTRRKVCSACGAENVIPYNSPAAVNHRQTLAHPVVAPQ